MAPSACRLSNTSDNASWISLSEGDEAFTVELSTGDSAVDSDVFERIIVMIRDDDR